MKTMTRPACCPQLFYDDADAAIRFLTGAFGFAERFAHRDPSGTICHAQLALGDAVIMLGSTSLGFIRPVTSPKKAGHMTGQVYLYVPDVDAHCARARKAGAEILLEPADQLWGERIYCAADSEGHVWTFATARP